MYHFIGIKGTGMSALAQIMKSLGFEVQGSDVEKYFFTEERLIKNNINYFVFDKNNIKKGMDIVQGNAFDDDNVEVKEAKKLGLKIYTYPELVGKLSKMFQTISVSGCHGKTTTSSMIKHVFEKVHGVNYLIGDGSGYASKDNEIFVLEACEYKRHFLNYTQKYGVITNIDLDHVDYFKDINDIINAFNSFANNVTNTLVACGDNEYISHIKTSKKIIYYGFSSKNNVVAKNIEYFEKGTKFDVYIDGEFYNDIEILLGGEHNVLNALATISICYLENIEKNIVKEALKTFNGAKRRFTEEKIGNNIMVDDYAHHPAEIIATINDARQKYPNKKLISVFQPHTFSRTLKFADQIVDALNKSDVAYLLNIYPSREKKEDFPEVNEENMIKKLKNGYHMDSLNADELLKYDNAVILFMCPGDISKLENDYREKRKKICELQ